MESANAEVRGRGHPADVALRAVEVTVTRDATIDTRAFASSLTGEPEWAIVALGDAIASCSDTDAAVAAGPDFHAFVVGRVGTLAHAGARAASRRLTLLDRRALESVATRVDADETAERAVVIGVARKLCGTGVAKRVGHASSRSTPRAPGATSSGTRASSASGAHHAAGACFAAGADHATDAASASATGGADASGSSSPSGSPRNRRAAVTAAHEERERQQGNRPQPAAGDIHSCVDCSAFHVDQFRNPAWQLGVPPSRGDAQTCRTGQSLTFEQLPPLGTHSMRPSGQRPTQSKPVAQSAPSRQSPYCPHTVVLPAPAVSQTGADTSAQSEFKQATGID